MQELDLESLVWRPEEPDHKLAGRLRFNPMDGAVLSFLMLLRECGVSLDSLTNIRNHEHFIWLADELASSSR